MDWQSIVQTTLSIAVASGVIGFLVKSLIKLYINKDIERFKSQLLQEQIRFSKLHEERANVIKDLYGKLRDLELAMNKLVVPLELTGQPKKEALLPKVTEAGNEFLNYYNKNRIYFSKRMCALIDKINKEFREMYVDWQVYQPHTLDAPDVNQDDRIRRWSEIWKKSEKDIPELREQIEEEFRTLLGVKE